VVDLPSGVLRIAQRNWRGDIDDPKSKTSKRPLTLGYLVDRYRVKAAADKAEPENWVFTRTDGSGLPLWDSGVRQALKLAAADEGCDFSGLGPHSFRRANITWRQEVGGSSIEASKIAGHSTVRMTEEYTTGRTYAADPGAAGQRGRETAGGRAVEETKRVIGYAASRSSRSIVSPNDCEILGAIDIRRPAPKNRFSKSGRLLGLAEGERSTSVADRQSPRTEG